MSLDFENDRNIYKKPIAVSSINQKPAYVRFLMQKGVSEKNIQILLYIIAFVCMLASISIIWATVSTGGDSGIPSTELNEEQQNAARIMNQRMQMQ